MGGVRGRQGRRMIVVSSAMRLVRDASVNTSASIMVISHLGPTGCAGLSTQGHDVGWIAENPLPANYELVAEAWRS
jgi:hypothetical protein